MKLNTGDIIERNKKNMVYPTINTNTDVKYIAAGNKYKVTSIRTAANGSVYKVKSFQTSVSYEVSQRDMTDFFDKTEDAPTKPEEKVAATPEDQACKCYTKCDPFHLLTHGCKYSTLVEKLKKYDREMLGPKMGEE